METQCSALFFSSKSYLPKHVEIFSSGTYLKVGIIEQSYDFFFQAEDGIRDPLWSRGLGDVYKRQQL